MSQWSGLNIHVIKTKRIECTKLNLPDVLTRPQSCPPSKHIKKASLNSTSDSSQSPDSSWGYQRDHSSHPSIAESLPIELEAGLSPLKTPEADEVFECTFETASEDPVNHRNVITRCLSLPCLSCERNIAKDSRVCRLSHEAFNLESPLRDSQSRLVREASEGFWTGFPRDQESEECESVKGIGMKRSRTPHAESMNRTDTLVLIADSNNNNSSSRGYKRGVNPSTLARAQSSLELRQDWEQKILGLTSASTFGAERVGNREAELPRPRSVTLTGNLHNLVSAQNQTTRDRDSERRTKSESKQKMPKLQSVVWDYFKRRSTKRKSKRGSQSKGNANPKESKKNSSKENSEKDNQTTSSENQGLGNGSVKNNNLELDNRVSSPTQKGVKISRNKSWSYSNSTKAPGGVYSLARWKSTPSLKYSEAKESIRQLRKNSAAEVPSPKVASKLRMKEFEDDPEILKLLLTTSPEERPMEERLKTLMLSREWLLKELQSMREEDRRLARQFINLRSAIVEIRQAREKEESDYDSEGEGHKTRLIDSQKLAVEKKGRKTRERTLQMHVTPTRNILSYC